MGILRTPATVPVAATGKVEVAATAKADVLGSTDEEVEAPTKSVVAWPRLSVVTSLTFGNRTKGSNSGLALYAGDGASGSHGKGRRHGIGNRGRRGKHGRVCRGTNEVGGGPAAAVGGNGNSAKAVEGSAPTRCYGCGKQGHIRANCTKKLCSRCNGRGHTANVTPTSKKQAVLAVTGELGARNDDRMTKVRSRLRLSMPKRQASWVMGLAE